MLSEIGSNFWTTPDDENKTGEIDFRAFDIKFTDYALFSTCRAAISFVLENIETQNISRKIALLPPFLCHTVIEPFLKAGYEFYH